MSDACVSDWAYVAGDLDMTGASQDVKTYVVVIRGVVPDSKVWTRGSEVSEDAADGEGSCAYGWVVGVVGIRSGDESAAALSDAADIKSVDKSAYVVADAAECTWTG